ncbi:hypothetical protein MEP402_gp06 [Methylophilales phage MEP402]|nr:hypothetical protein MEP402_gp06 [Methylophilales phage MEP402]
MKPISHTTFVKKYSIKNSNALVKEGDKFYLTNDLYIMRSTHRKRLHNYYPHDFVGPRHTHEYIQVFKLMSEEYSLSKALQDQPELALMVWNDDYVYVYRHQSINKYAPAYIKSRHHESRAMFDAIYYTMHPLEMKYKDGRLKSGFKNHLIRRIKGFAKSSNTTQVMLKTLLDYLSTNYQDDLFNPSLIDKANEFVDNEVKLYQCPLTKVINYRSQMTQFSLSGKTHFCHLSMDSDILESEYGYEYDPDNHTFLLKHEIMIDGTCYDERTVNIVRCDSCNSKCVEQETRDGLCVECCGRDYRVHNYTHRVEETLGFDKANKLANEPYLGIEMEFQVDKRRAGRLYVGDSMFGHALMKDDGSIRNGFELVSRPAGYTSHLARYDSFLTDLPEYIHPHESCGMHVHISRTAFTQLGAGKLVEFMNREDNKSFIKLMAGRGSTNYQTSDPSFDIKTPYGQAYKDRYVGRYNFVNLNNKKTIELRIFATPADKVEFNIRMQFVKAMIEYCKPAIHSVSLRQQTHFKSFVSWLTNTKKDFKELHNYIKESTICA